MKNVSVAGYGYVGKAMVELLRGHYNVYIYDPKYVSLDSHLENAYFVNSISDLNNVDAEIGVVCVPTPMNEETHACDTSLVEDAVNKLETPVILIKSTVTPGTTDRLKKETGKRICFSAEFIGESKYWSPYAWDTDMKATPWVVVGGDSADTEIIFDLLAPILGPKKQYRSTSAKVAEVVKYWENTFFAMKVTFANEMYSICEALGVPYWETRDIWGLDPRVDLMHTAVFKDNRGYGGKCFPKDTNALVEASKKAGYVPELLVEMIKSNERFKTLNK